MTAQQVREDWPAILGDVTIVVAFAAIGRASHHESVSVAAVINTALPFLAAALIAHLVYHFRRTNSRTLRHGTVLWLITWLAGMLLRLATGASVSVPFVAVAGLFLAVGLLGWRFGYLAVTRVQARRRVPPAER